MDELTTKNTSLQTSQGTSVSAQNALTSIWGLPPTAVQEAVKAANSIRTTHGMFAAVPIICKEDDCPYLSTCQIDPTVRQLGMRCPQEIGAIIGRFEMWCSHFGVDLSNATFKVEDITDASLIRDLVDLEVQTVRAENRLAMSSDFIGLTINTVDNKGKVHYEETVTPEAEYKLTLNDKRYKILQLLNSTRKDKAAMMKKDQNPSIKAVSIFKKINEKVNGALDDLESLDITDDNTVATTTAIAVEFENTNGVE